MADFTLQICVEPDFLRPLWYAGLAAILPRQRGKMDLCCLMRIGLSGAVAGPLARERVLAVLRMIGIGLLLFTAVRGLGIQVNPRRGVCYG